MALRSASVCTWRKLSQPATASRPSGTAIAAAKRAGWERTMRYARCYLPCRRRRCSDSSYTLELLDLREVAGEDGFSERLDCLGPREAFPPGESDAAHRDRPGERKH